MRIPIKALREFGKKYHLTHVIVLAHDSEQDHVATWGRTIEQCSQAADFGNSVKEFMGWPKSLCDAQPPRVRKLQAENEQLKAELASLRAEGKAE